VDEKIPLFVVEDQPAFLKGLTKILSTFPEVELVGTAMNGDTALKELPKSGARVALVDIELPGIDGLSLVSQLRAAHVVCELLMLTSFVNEEKVFEAMQRGAAGYLVKGASAERLHAAILSVNEGGTVIEPKLAKTFWSYFKGVESPPRADPILTAEELELLTLVGKGLSNAETGSVLGLPRRNVRTRLQKIYDKLGARSHVDAVVVALRRGLIQI
jgi:DNA-binding NarL/FixJ family response regulator